MGCGASVGHDEGGTDAPVQKRHVKELEVETQLDYGEASTAIEDYHDSIPESEPVSPAANTSLDEVMNKGWICDFYDLKTRVLHRGAATSVVEATHKDTDKLFAVKRCKIEQKDEEEQELSPRFAFGQSRSPSSESLVGPRSKPTVEEQVPMMYRLRDHKNIVRLHETFADGRSYFFVLEHCIGGTLLDQLASSDTMLDEREASTVMRQTLRAVQHMHSRGIAHRDLKLEHLLLKEKGILPHCQLKVIDFSSACLLEPGGPPLKDRDVGTPYYRSPQVCKGEYTHLCDVWSCGVVLYVCLLGIPGKQTRPRSRVPTRPTSPTSSYPGVPRPSNSPRVMMEYSDTFRKPWSPGGHWATPPPDMRMREQDQRDAVMSFGPEVQRAAFSRSASPERACVKEYGKEQFVYSPADVQLLTRDAQDLLDGLLTPAEDKRISVARALEHEWINRHAKQAWHMRSISQPRRPPSNPPPSLRVSPDNKRRKPWEVDPWDV